MTERALKFTVDPGLGPTWVDTATEPRWLAAGGQGPRIVAWCMAEPGEGFRTALYGVLTGQGADPKLEYIGTGTTNEGIVVHVFRAPVIRVD